MARYSHYFISTFLFVFSATAVIAQVMDKRWGDVTLADLDMKTYPKDSTASAVYLNEVANAFVSDESNEGIVFEHYFKLKILRKEGFDFGNFAIRLHKQDHDAERFSDLTLTTYNLEGTEIKATQLDRKNIFTENSNQYTDYVKFTAPDIREGTVIECKYRTVSPFFRRFHPWVFQADIPKIHSEYWTTIPGNYQYNVTLRGFLKLTKYESNVVKNCFVGRDSECTRNHYVMDNVPAFIEEEDMTARKNFESAIYFELGQVTLFNGRTEKYTVEWSDVDKQFANSADFGDQIKKAKSIYAGQAASWKLEKDTLARAMAAYNFIKYYFTTDKVYSSSAVDGVKKSYENKKGSFADINLSLLGALQAAGVNASPVILSTRWNGSPTEIHPVVSDFNYVLASFTVANKRYFLDATDDFYPFGLISMEALNGKGRLMEKTSLWVDLKPAMKQRTAISAELALSETGFDGTIKTNYQGYDAVEHRKDFHGAGDQEKYLDQLQSKWKFDISDYQIRREDSVDLPLEEIMKIKKELPQETPGTIYFNPFIVRRWSENPFKSTNRSYPVDFGAPLEDVYILNLTIPADYEVEESPVPTSLALPKAGGKLFFNVAELGNKITITFNVSLNKPVYPADEYPSLREFFARLIQSQQSQIVLKKKK